MQSVPRRQIFSGRSFPSLAAVMASSFFETIHLPDETVSHRVIDYVKFTLSGYKSECMVCQTTAYILGSSMKSSPYNLEWTHITTCVVAITRARIRKKRRYKWVIDFHMHSIQKGLPLWVTRLGFNCQYTSIKDAYHLFSLGYNQGILCLQFHSQPDAQPFNETFVKWLQEGPQPERNPLPLNPPPMALSAVLISEPIEVVAPVEGTRALKKGEIGSYLKEREKLINDMDALKTTGKQRKIENFPLYLSMLPRTIIDYPTDSLDGSDLDSLLSFGSVLDHIEKC